MIGLLWLGSLVCAAAFSHVAAHAADAPLNAQLGGDAQRTRFVAFLSKKVDYRIFSIADPYRIVVDLPEADIQVPGEKSRGLVLSSRAGVLSEGKSRIVIDLLDPATVEKSEMLPPENGVPARLVIDLTKSSHKAFVAASKAATPPAAMAAPAAIAMAPPGPSDNRPVIVVDAGHGGVDAGAHGRTSNVPEKDVTLDFSIALRDALAKLGRFRVIMSRSTDVFVSLEDRAELASSQKAQLLVSIHADAVDPKLLGLKGLQEVSGGTVYTLADQPSDETASAFAQSENKADLQAGLSTATPQVSAADLDGILSDLETRGKKNRSVACAGYLISHLQDKFKFNKRPHKSANLRVLKAAGVPAVLLELGYLSNDEDEKRLTSKEWRSGTAGHVAAVLGTFLAERQAQLPL